MCWTLMAYRRESDEADRAYAKERDDADREAKYNLDATNLAIDQLTTENKELTDKYTALENQTSLEKYANTPEVKSFMSSVHTPMRFNEQNGRVTLNGKTAAFDTYEEYIDAVIEKWHKEGR